MQYLVQQGRGCGFDPKDEILEMRTKCVFLTLCSS